MKKYKLIHKTTGEEHLCEKVTSSIYGFDLYLDPNMDAVADNNPSSTLPKVIDEAEELAWDTVNNHSSLKTDSEKAIGFTSFYEGYNKHAETHPYSEDNLYDIMDFIARTPETKGMFKGDILKLWQSQRPKVIYYK